MENEMVVNFFERRRISEAAERNIRNCAEESELPARRVRISRWHWDQSEGCETIWDNDNKSTLPQMDWLCFVDWLRCEIRKERSKSWVSCCKWTYSLAQSSDCATKFGEDEKASVYFKFSSWFHPRDNFRVNRQITRRGRILLWR